MLINGNNILNLSTKNTVGVNRHPALDRVVRLSVSALELFEGDVLPYGDCFEDSVRLSSFGDLFLTYRTRDGRVGFRHLMSKWALKGLVASAKGVK